MGNNVHHPNHPSLLRIGPVSSSTAPVSCDSWGEDLWQRVGMSYTHGTAQGCSSGPGERGEKSCPQRLKDCCTIGEKQGAGKATSSMLICFRKDFFSEHLVSHFTHWKIHSACRDSRDMYLKDHLPLLKTSVKPSNELLRYCPLALDICPHFNFSCFSHHSFLPEQPHAQSSSPLL